MDALYCGVCKTGAEKAVSEALADAGATAAAGTAIEVIPSEVERRIVRHGKPVVEKRALMPGYIFLSASDEPDWMALRKAGLWHPLHYGDGTTALRGGDLEFVRWLKANKGKLGQSKAVREGTRIRIVSGALASLRGTILSVNLKRRSVLVGLETESLFNKVWMSIELVEPNENEACIPAKV
jgi:transcription antitermination factor NusG